MGNLTMLNKNWTLFLLLFSVLFFLGEVIRLGMWTWEDLKENDRGHCVKLPNSQYNIMLEEKKPA